MNSSGIKRGLAATAVSALAIAGIPLLASSASATPGETLTVVSVGPTLNGGDLGGQVHLKLSSTIVANDINGTNSDLEVANPNLNGPASNGNQAVEIVGTPTYIANGAAGDSNPTDGLAEAIVNVKVTTSDTGSTATYAIYVDDDGGHQAGPPEVPDVDAGEARVQVSQATSGPLASIDVTPTSQGTSQGVQSGAYTVTAKDAQGRTTQLNTGETVDISSSNNAEVPPSDAQFTAAEMQDGSHTFTATPSANPASLGTTTFTVDPQTLPVDLPASAVKSVTLTVTAAAVVNNANMIDIVTAADDWDGFGGGTLGGTTAVRVDQGSIKIDIKGSTPGGTVTLNLDGDTDNNPATPFDHITFGGKTTSTVSTVLDAQGNGTLTITPDAGTIQENETIDITGSFAQTLVFERGAADAVVAAQDLYFSAPKATTTVSAKIVDQFGNPVTTGFVSAYISAGPNQGTPPGQVKAVGADGTVSFDFTDTKATVGQSDTVTFSWVPDQFTPPTAALQDTATIKYTATGQGADFNTSLDTVNTGAPTYKSTDVTVNPLATDGVADTDATEYVAIAVAGAEPNQAITLSVDNGALIVDSTAGGDTVAEGKASVTVTTTGAGALPAGLRIIGTKSGETTLTITSANRTETAKFTVAAQTDTTTARNVEVTGDETVPHGTTQVPFTVKVTDAFGNGVANVAVSSLNIQVTGPGQFQDSSGVTNANGELTVNVRADADAAGEIGITVTGLPNAATNQFGAGANQLDSAAATNSAPGFTVSDNQGSDSTTIEAAPEPVDPNVTVTGKSKGKKDKITVQADAAAAGASVVVKGGGQTKTGTLNADGKLVLTFKDKNGNKKKTKYTITVGATEGTTAKTVTRKFK